MEEDRLRNLGTCEDCFKVLNDCPLYICYDDGFIIACCIIYAIKKNLKILGLVGDQEEE